MNVIVVGCGRVGAELAYRLYQKGNQVVVLDIESAAFNNLPPDFRGRTVEGEGLSQDVLHRAEIEQADGLAAVTNSDAVNAVVAHVAHTVYNVPKVVVRNYDSRWQSLHEAFGLPVVSSTVWGAQRIEELLHHGDMRIVFSAGNGEVSLYEFIAPAGAYGRTLQEVFPEDQCRVMAVTRDGRAILPTDNFRFEDGDIIHVSATPASLAELRTRLNLPQED
jgi:trk system potassium uptake protein TrkA